MNKLKQNFLFTKQKLNLPNNDVVNTFICMTLLEYYITVCEDLL